MATYDEATSTGFLNSRDKLASLKNQLEQANADVKRLTAATVFLNTNPGAEALINSL